MTTKRKTVKKLTPGKIIWEHFDGNSNFVTPDAIAYGRVGTRGRLVYELSTGVIPPIFTDLEKKSGPDVRTWGVTVVAIDGEHTETSELSQGGFLHLDAAKQYIETLDRREQQSELDKAL